MDLHAMLLENLPIAIKLILAIFLGGVIGVERTLANKNAGLRTYAFVSLGACLLVIISLMVTAQYVGQTNFDPLRIAAAIIMGIGFLTGGIIVYHDNKLEGITTAAGMWVATGIGIAVGYGLFVLATLATLLTIFVFATLWNFETKVKSTFESENHG